MFLLLLTFLGLSTGAKAESVVLNTPTAIEIAGVSATSDEFTHLCDVLKAEVSAWSLNTQASSCKATEALSTTFDAYTGFSTLVQVEYQAASDRYSLTIRALDRADSLEPKAVGWYVKRVGDTEVVLRKLMRDYARFETLKDSDKKRMMEFAMNGPLTDEKFATQYKTFTHDPANARFIAAGLELAATLGVSAIAYYNPPPSRNSNAQDWDFKNLGSRVDGRGYRFDDNSFHTNIGHIYAGNVYDLIARGSGLSRLQSYLFTNAASALWECCAEYREVFSINDTVMTGTGGFILGETFFQLSKIVRKHKNDNFAWRAANSIFSSPAKGNQWIEHKVTGDKHQYTDLSDGELDFWSKLEIYGVDEQFAEGAARGWGISGTVINIPDFEAPGKVSRAYLTKDTVESDFEYQTASGKGVAFTKLMAKIVLSAIYSKNISLDDKDRLQGYQMYVGPSMGADLRQKEVDGQPTAGNGDFTSVVHVLGGTAKVIGYYKGTRFTFDLDLFGDFAMIHSPSFDTTMAGKLEAGGDFSNCGNIQSVLCKHNYSYDLGETARGGVTVQNGRFQAGVTASTSNYDIINARTRFYETAAPLSNRDLISSLNTFVAVDVTSRFKIEVGAEKYVHQSNYSDPNNSGMRTLRDGMKYGKVIWAY